MRKRRASDLFRPHAGEGLRALHRHPTRLGRASDQSHPAAAGIPPDSLGHRLVPARVADGGASRTPPWHRPQGFLGGSATADSEKEIKALNSIKFQLALKVQLRKDHQDGSEEYTAPELRHK